MDPASAAGLAIGVASLVFEVFDSSVKAFKFLSLMVDMPEDCKHCQLKLVIEYNRLLAWGKAVGLISAAEDSDIAASLGTNAVELCGILSRITWLLEEFKEVNNRWKIESPDGIPDRDTLDASVVSEMVSNLEFAYEETKSKEVYKRVRKQSRLKQWMSKLVADAKEIGSHPSRIRWAMVDKNVFEELLQDLRFLTDRLYQLLVEHRQKRVADITAETYRELVLTRTNVEELKSMLEAMNSLVSDCHSLKANCHVVNDKAFRDLLRLKEINRTADTILALLDSDDSIDVNVAWKGLIKVPEYDGATFQDYFIYSDENDNKTAARVTRARGALICDGSAVESWIEWRYNEKRASEITRNKASRLRVMTLAQMLHSTKPSELYAPNCIGFIDDATDNDRYGWIFEMPGGSKKEDKLKTLHSLLGQAKYKPTLGERITIAWKLASSLLYLHTVDWLHKGIHSGNVVFAFDGDKFKASQPILSGFDFSRPQSNRTTSRSLEPKWELYRWPGIQNEAPKAETSRKTYDIYSLGLVLLEVAHWRPLNELLCLRRWPIPSNQDARTRMWLLGEDFPLFKSNPLPDLREVAGDRYWRAVRRCIVAHGEEGLGVEETTCREHCVAADVKLQQVFNELVVQELKKVSV